MPSKLILVLLAAASIAMPTSAYAQRRAAGSGGGGRAVGSAVPRGGGGRPDSPGRIGGAPYRPYSYPYRYYRPGISLGFYAGLGYPYYGYYPYGYGYPFYSPYGYAYSGYGYGYPGYSYAYPPSGSANGQPVAGWGGLRIEDAPRDAQVFVDGYYVGIVDDFDGSTQRLDLEAGVHRIEIRIVGQQPKMFDVNIQVGQTITYHAR